MGASDEVKVLGKLTRELEALQPDARRRVLNYLAETMAGAKAGPTIGLVNKAVDKSAATAERR